MPVAPGLHPVSPGAEAAALGPLPRPGTVQAPGPGESWALGSGDKRLGVRCQRGSVAQAAAGRQRAAESTERRHALVLPPSSRCSDSAGPSHGDTGPRELTAHSRHSLAQSSCLIDMHHLTEQRRNGANPPPAPPPATEVIPKLQVSFPVLLENADLWRKKAIGHPGPGWAQLGHSWEGTQLKPLLFLRGPALPSAWQDSAPP